MTTLYRFFDQDEELLYVGISVSPWSRWRQHRHDKPWWCDVATIGLESHPTREAALAAEKVAIQSEHHRYNIVHNGQRGRALDLVVVDGDNGGRWYIEALRSGYGRQTDLHLIPEPNGLAVLCDYDEDEHDVEIYVDWLERHYGEVPDEVPIHWSVGGDSVLEAAPAGEVGRNILTHFTWPEDVETGERCSFYALPIRHRFPTFWERLGYQPAPMQMALPMRSILAGAPQYEGARK